MEAPECGDSRAWSVPGYGHDVEAVCTRRPGHNLMRGQWPPLRQTGIWWDDDGEHRTDDHEPDERPWK